MITFWIADGDQYVEMARRSARSLKAHMPDMMTVLGSPGGSVEGFDRIVGLSQRQHEWWYRDSVRYFNEMLAVLDGDLLYLDCDTYVCAPLHDFMELLQRFDFVGAHAPGRKTALTASNVPAAFCEINVGVLGIRHSKSVVDLFQDWSRRMDLLYGTYGNNDQAPLREALWDSNLRLYVVPPEYNMRWEYGGYARYPIKVLHGRSEDYEAVNKELNVSEDFRVWRKEIA